MDEVIPETPQVEGEKLSESRKSKEPHSTEDAHDEKPLQKKLKTEDDTSQPMLVEESPSSENPSKSEVSINNEDRAYKKQRVAMLVGYIGTKYQGLQWNPSASTIELSLQKALTASGSISQANSDDLNKIGWHRASRTDKGVHAARQVVTAKILRKGEVSSQIKDINDNLPEDIIMYDIIRVGKAFNPKLVCESREYEYLLPTMCLHFFDGKAHLPSKCVDMYDCVVSDSSEVSKESSPPTNCEKLVNGSEKNEIVDSIATKTPDKGKADSSNDHVNEDVAMKEKSNDDNEEQMVDNMTTESVDVSIETEKVIQSSSTDSHTLLNDGDNVMKGESHDGAPSSPVSPVQTSTHDSNKMPVTQSENQDTFDIKKFRVTKEVLDYFRLLMRKYVGTHFYHNFTNGKTHADPSCRRYLIDITVSNPIIVSDVEYVAIHLHGQSFLLHQIRKMIGAALLIMYGQYTPNFIETAFQKNKLPIPLVPGVGLLLNKLHYDRYMKKSGRELAFKSSKEKVDEFKKKIHAHIAEKELEERTFREWIKHTRNFGDIHPMKPNDEK